MARGDAGAIVGVGSGSAASGRLSRTSDLGGVYAERLPSRAGNASPRILASLDYRALGSMKVPALMT